MIPALCCELWRLLPTDACTFDSARQSSTNVLLCALQGTLWISFTSRLNSGASAGAFIFLMPGTSAAFTICTTSLPPAPDAALHKRLRIQESEIKGAMWQLQSCIVVAQFPAMRRPACTKTFCFVGCIHRCVQIRWALCQHAYFVTSPCQLHCSVLQNRGHHAAWYMQEALLQAAFKTQKIVVFVCEQEHAW